MWAQVTRCRFIAKRARCASSVMWTIFSTEILYGIGAWPQVIAVSQFCTYPDDVKNKPLVNGWDKTNLEQVMALKPDFVIGVDAQEPFLRNKLTGLGVRSLFVKSQTLAEVLTSIGEI